MKIRSVLSAAVLAVATTVAATQALAQDKFTLRLAETWGPNFPILVTPPNASPKPLTRCLMAD